jgi:hypothetical protein
MHTAWCDEDAVRCGSSAAIRRMWQQQHGTPELHGAAASADEVMMREALQARLLGV